MSIQVEWAQGQDRFPHLHWRLDAEAYTAFRRFGTEHTLADGERIFEEGDPSFSLYLVIEGEVAIEREGVRLAKLEANHSFGELGLLRDAPRSGAAVAVGDVRVLEIGRQGIHMMLQEAPLWAARLYRVLAECLAGYLAEGSPGSVPK